MTTVQDIVGDCLARIAQREPAVHAWAHLDTTAALAQARFLDREPIRGPFHGVPIGIKDIIDTADMPTSYGSPIYAGHRPPADAACVAALRSRGAVILGKTVTAEFAHRFPGETRNPHDLRRTPGGSSSGSAAAVADFMVPAALGTQTTASILRPASYCGVVGFRPTYGHFSCSGIRQCSASFDTVGMFARTVDDAAFMHDALAGVIPRKLDSPPSGLRVGVCRTPLWHRLAAEIARQFEELVVALGLEGFQIHDFEIDHDFESIAALHRLITSYELARNLHFELVTHPSALSTELREGKLAEGWRHEFSDYTKAKQRLRAARAEFERKLHRTQVILAPAAENHAPQGLASTGVASFATYWTAMHGPCISVPIFQSELGLPVGLQAVAGQGLDRQLLAFAGRVAELTGYWHRPDEGSAS